MPFFGLPTTVQIMCIAYWMYYPVKFKLLFIVDSILKCNNQLQQTVNVCWYQHLCTSCFIYLRLQEHCICHYAFPIHIWWPLHRGTMKFYILLDSSCPSNMGLYICHLADCQTSLPLARMEDKMTINKIIVSCLRFL